MDKKISINIIFLIFLSGCSLSPGMHMTYEGGLSQNKTVYVKSLDKEIEIENISDNLSLPSKESYRIGKGDQIAITVWGIPDVFPLSNINPEQNLRRVDSNGNIFFPYVGSINAAEKTQNQLRNDLSVGLSAYFTEPQLDVSIVRFNSQKVYLLGEVSSPKKINITDIPLSLSDALGLANGLNTNTSAGNQVFVIRQAIETGSPRIFQANLSSPAGFIEAGRFYLADNDIIYVNAKNTTRWNRVISQFFPFSSFLNSIDNLTSD